MTTTKIGDFHAKTRPVQNNAPYSFLGWAARTADLRESPLDLDDDELCFSVFAVSENAALAALAHEIHDAGFRVIN